MTSTRGEHTEFDDWQPGSRQVFRALLELARQYKGQFIVVAVFSFLYTGLDLLQPLIYKQAINAVAGLFVNEVPGASAVAGGVAAQTPQQTFHTLMVSVVLLFFIAVGSYFFYQRANYYGARVASYIESKLIVDTFGHVLRLGLPLLVAEG